MSNPTSPQLSSGAAQLRPLWHPRRLFFVNSIGGVHRGSPGALPVRGGQGTATVGTPRWKEEPPRGTAAAGPRGRGHGGAFPRARRLNTERKAAVPRGRRAHRSPYCIQSPCKRECTTGVLVLGRGTAIGAPEAALLSVFNQPETHEEPSGSLSLSLSLSVSLSRYP